MSKTFYVCDMMDVLHTDETATVSFHLVGSSKLISFVADRNRHNILADCLIQVVRENREEKEKKEHQDQQWEEKERGRMTSSFFICPYSYEHFFFDF